MKKLFRKIKDKFSITAFLLNYLWLLINRCFLPLFIFISLHFILSVLADKIPITQKGMLTANFYGIPYYPYIQDIPIYLYVIFSLIIGYKGNDWVLKKADSSNREKIKERLRKQDIVLKSGIIWAIYGFLVNTPLIISAMLSGGTFGGLTEAFILMHSIPILMIIGFIIGIIKGRNKLKLNSDNEVKNAQ